MFAAYEAENPGVTIENKKAATSNEARDNLNTRLASGSGASDVEMIEIDWLPELMQYPDKFADLTDPDARRTAGSTGRSRRPRRPTASCSATAPTSARRPSRTAATCSPPPACPPTVRRSPPLLGGADATWDDYFDVRQAVHRGHGQALLRRCRCHLPGHDQPGRERLRGQRRHDHRRREPRGEGRSTTPSPRPPSPTTCRPTSASGATTGTPRSRRTASRPCWPRAGCSASSRATRPA